MTPVSIRSQEEATKQVIQLGGEFKVSVLMETEKKDSLFPAPVCRRRPHQ